MNRLLIYLGHPAHFHLFRGLIHAWTQMGKEALVLISRKDILEDLVREEGIAYINILPKGRGRGWHGMLLGFLMRSWKIYHISRRYKPDVMTGTSAELPLVGSLRCIPVVNLNEDDHDVVPLYSRISYPFSTYILMPEGVRAGKWHKKVLRYPGYHELAYLHPKQFHPDKCLVNEILGHEEPYFLLRLSALKAHHDTGIKGIGHDLVLTLINKLRMHGRVYISAEAELPADIAELRLSLNPLQVHHVMAFAQIFIGDSQTMAAEAAMLGVPYIRYNSFVGRISYLDQLENVWKLGYGFLPGQEQALLDQVDLMLINQKLRSEYLHRRDLMISHKIDTSGFLVWFYATYPESIETMKNEPGWWSRFNGKSISMNAMHPGAKD